MNSHRLPQELPPAHSHHYNHVIEEPFRPVSPVTTIYTLTKPVPAPQPPERFVETLRARGIKVRVQHFRWLDLPYGEELSRVSKHERKTRGKGNVFEIFQNGGETHVSVQLPDGREAKGVAVCSTADQYRKKLGVFIAAKRALAALKSAKPVIGSGIVEIS